MAKLAYPWGRAGARQQVVACPLSRPGAGVGVGERAEDLFWLPGHVRVRGTAFMLQDRYDSVGGEIKTAVRLGRVPGLLESGEGEPERGVDVFGFVDRECPDLTEVASPGT